jgi:hypothetical protein
LIGRLSVPNSKVEIMAFQAYAGPVPVAERRFSVSTCGNLTQRLTTGLDRCYRELLMRSLGETHGEVVVGRNNNIAAATGITLLLASVFYAEDDDTDGALNLADPLDAIMPLLGGRFRLKARLGQGAFCQTLMAEDLYHPERRLVAIKIMHMPYNVIGHEVRLILVAIAHAPTRKPSGFDGSTKRIATTVATLSASSRHLSISGIFVWPLNCFNQDRWQCTRHRSNQSTSIDR